jgi:hypothetical protein
MTQQMKVYIVAASENAAQHQQDAAIQYAKSTPGG